MTLEVLISCMHQKDSSIAQNSHVQSDAVIVNQCDYDAVVTERLYSHCIKFICTTERGLSRSRNMAISSSEADICLIADDDEIFADDYQQQIIKAYEQHPEADLITFKVEGSHSYAKAYAQKESRIGYLKAMHISSVQITFRRNSIIQNNIFFDPEMGSGTGNGCGEETKFLFDCLHKGLKIIHEPVTIAKLNDNSNSQWFNGFTEQFFYNRGWATTRYLGRPFALLYAIIYPIQRKKKVRKDISISRAILSAFKGVFHSSRC